MGPPGKKTMGSEAARIREELKTGKNPLSEEEIQYTSYRQAVKL